MVAGVLFILALLLLMAGGVEPPTTAEEALTTYAGQELLFRTVDGIYVGIILLFIPGVLALYLSLKEVNKTYMLIASGLLGAAIALSLVQVTVDYSLIGLSGEHAAATGEAQQAAYRAAADLAIGAMAANSTIADLLYGFATLVASVVMLKSVFGKGTAYLGIVAGILGMFGAIPVPAIIAIAPIFFILYIAWFLAAGYRLYTLG